VAGVKKRHQRAVNSDSESDSSTSRSPARKKGKADTHTIRFIDGTFSEMELHRQYFRCL
jgi:hypothetical protein